jgi:hypothetical protein
VPRIQEIELVCRSYSQPHTSYNSYAIIFKRERSIFTKAEGRNFKPVVKLDFWNFVGGMQRLDACFELPSSWKILWCARSETN